MGIKKILTYPLRKLIFNRVPGRAWGMENQSTTARFVEEDPNDKDVTFQNAFEVFLNNNNKTVPTLINDAKSHIDDSDALNYLHHEDGKALWLGLELPYGSIEVSPYKPGIGNQDLTYYRYKDNAVWDKNDINDISPYSNYFLFKRSNTNPNPSEWLETKPFRSTKISLGRDNNGDYISYYKYYDYNDPRLEKLLGTEVPEFYDRVYLDDVYGLEDDERGAYWLPEIEVWNRQPNETKHTYLSDGWEKANLEVLKNMVHRTYPNLELPDEVYRRLDYTDGDSIRNGLIELGYLKKGGKIK